MVGAEGASSKLRAPQFFQVPYTALTMLLTPSPPERDSATAYRECAVEGRVAPDGCELGPLSAAHCVPGMTMEMAGTLLGAAAHGLIVSGAHGPHSCEDSEFPGSGAVSTHVVSAPSTRASSHQTLCPGGFSP